MKEVIIKILVLTILTSFTVFGQKKEKDLFPPIDIKSWDKTPCVNGRLATKKETESGTALLYYDKKENAKPYNMTLPKLAYLTHEKLNSEQPYNDGKPREKVQELVVVIQIVQTPKDTMVGYRPLTGSNGASVFRDFRFLTDDEVKKLTGK